MCGIAGIVRRTGEAVNVRELSRMTDAIAHRGPDGEGFHVDGGVGIGHRRLAIIDLSTGDQPMASPDGGAWIVYNGEVYNYRELRAELSARGFAFRTTSDTEVVLRAYEAWGVESLRRLRGMFAFAIWDARRRRVLLARDRVGIKPLVWTWNGRQLAFASETKALLADPAMPRELDGEAIAQFFTHLFVPAPLTIFRGIHKLPPASYLTLSLEGGEPEIQRYWTLSLAPDERVSEANWIDGLGHLLHDAVDSHMVSDVPIGAFLSGGVDSSTVVACMARRSAASVKTFSIGFDEADFDELAHARRVAQRYGTEHVEMVVKPDVMRVLPQLAFSFDEPFADASAVPTYCVSKITRDHVTVALSGDGGDENFAGYTRYAQALALGEQADGFPQSLLRPLWRLAAASLPDGVRGRGHLARLGLSPVDRYFQMTTYADTTGLRALLAADAAPAGGPQVAPDVYRRLAAASGAPGYLSQMQYVDVHHYLPDDILTKVDRMSMLVSLESRVPLLDHVLMEYVATMPERMKYRAGVGKWVLKEAMRPHLPADLLSRRKMGFGVPLAGWFRGELKDFVREVLTDPRTRQRGLLRPEAVEAVLAEHLGGRRDRSSQLWALVMFELWCRTWWDRR